MSPRLFIPSVVFVGLTRLNRFRRLLRTFPIVFRKGLRGSYLVGLGSRVALTVTQWPQTGAGDRPDDDAGAFTHPQSQSPTQADSMSSECGSFVMRQQTMCKPSYRLISSLITCFEFKNSFVSRCKWKRRLAPMPLSFTHNLN